MADGSSATQFPAAPRRSCRDAEAMNIIASATPVQLFTLQNAIRERAQPQPHAARAKRIRPLGS